MALGTAAFSHETRTAHRGPPANEQGGHLAKQDLTIIAAVSATAITGGGIAGAQFEPSPLPAAATNACDLAHQADPAANYVVGNALGEVLLGTSAKDIIDGKGGKDDIRGRGGNDVICGGDDNDDITGGADNDHVFG